MKKYVANGKTVTEEEAKAIDKRNHELLDLAEKTGDMSYLMEAVFIFPYELVMA